MATTTVVMTTVVPLGRGRGPCPRVAALLRSGPAATAVTDVVVLQE